MEKIRIDCYSDVLCIWAFIGQSRMQELQSEFSEQIDVHWRYLPVFGDVPGKMEKSWKQRGGVTAYAAHVQQVAEEFPELNIKHRVWAEVTPYSSSPAHLWLCAARLQSIEAEEHFAKRIRKAFFTDGLDVGRHEVLRETAKGAGLCVEALERSIQSGEAWAQWSADMQQSRDEQIQASPTLIFNQGRQRLTGNVGYRIIKANLCELLEKPNLQHSWC